MDGEIFEHRIVALRGVDPSWDPAQLPGGRVLLEGREDSGFEFQVLRLARVMRACRPHIVHSRNWGAIEAIPAARLARVPVAIHSEHGYELDMLAGLPARRRVFRRVAFSMSDAVFAVTRELQQFHASQAWLAPEKIRVIYNGVDTERFAPSPEARMFLRRKYDVPENRLVIGTVGRIVPIKDHPTLLRAVEMLVQRGIDAHVLIVGAGPELERNQHLADSSQLLRSRVTFTGSSEEVPELLNTMDVFALPSISEGMSNTLLEAMASGLPVVATSVGGNTEIVEDQRSGLLFAARDAAALAQQLELFASRENLRREYAAAARRRAVERFSLQRMLQNYSELYLELAARRGVKPPGHETR